MRLVLGVFVTRRDYLSENVCSCVRETLSVSVVLHSSSVLTPRQTAVLIWTHSSSTLFYMLLLFYHFAFVCGCLNVLNTQPYLLWTQTSCVVTVLFVVFVVFFSFNVLAVNQSVKLCQTWLVACCVHVFSPGRKCDPCEQYVRHVIVSPTGFASQKEIIVRSLWKGSHKCAQITFWSQ